MAESQYILALDQGTTSSRAMVIDKSGNVMSLAQRPFPQMSRCTQIPESRLIVFNPFPGFNCIVTALKSRTLALKTRTKFLLKFVRDISAKMTSSFFRASVSVRDLSTNSSVNSGI
jgi:glycerol kinase